VPDVEVKSKFRKKTGVRKWTQMRAVLDTGCHPGDLVTLEVVQRLGIKKISTLTEQDNHVFQTISGETLRVRGTVNLTWRGVPKGRILNLTRDFKSQFLVIEVDDYDTLPFQIVIGKETLWKRGILQSPVLMTKPAQGRHTNVLPPKPLKEKDSKKQPKGTRPQTRCKQSLTCD
jgi:hypothetical protein